MRKLVGDTGSALALVGLESLEGGGTMPTARTFPLIPRFRSSFRLPLVGRRSNREIQGRISTNLEFINLVAALGACSELSRTIRSDAVVLLASRFVSFFCSQEGIFESN